MVERIILASETGKFPMEMNYFTTCFKGKLLKGGSQFKAPWFGTDFLITVIRTDPYEGVTINDDTKFLQHQISEDGKVECPCCGSRV